VFDGQRQTSRPLNPQSVEVSDRAGLTAALRARVGRYSVKCGKTPVLAPEEARVLLDATTPLPQPNAYAMIRRRAAAADIAMKIGKRTLRATGITAYLKNGGTLEKAAAMANQAPTRTTQLYDRRATR
jgi:hypothetical protein